MSYLCAHIGQGTTKLNDTYFNTSTYNTPAWRRMVTCQEIAHDFAQINTIYSHLDSANSYSMTAGLDQIAEQLLTPIYVPGDSMLEPWHWGTPVGWDEYGRANVFVRGIRTDHEEEESEEVLIHVFWLPPDPAEVDPIGRPSRSK